LVAISEEIKMNQFLEDKNNRGAVYMGVSLAAISVSAMIAKMVYSGISIDTIFDAIIGISTLLVSALVMFLAIRSIIKNTPQNIKQELESAFKNWEADTRPLIFKVSDFEEKEKYKICYAILSNPNDFLDLPQNLSIEWEAKLMTKNSKQSGKFLSLPSFDEMIEDDFNMEFHFIDSSYIEEKSEMKNLVSKTIKCISGRFLSIRATPKGSNDFSIDYNKILSKSDVGELIVFINFVIILFLIQSQQE
jgi:hypothetical protein